MSIAVGILLFVIAAFTLALLVRFADDWIDYATLLPLAGANVAAGVMNIAGDSGAWRLGVGVWLCVLAVCAFALFVGSSVSRLFQDKYRGAPGWVISASAGAAALFTTFGVLQLVMVA